MPRDGSQIYVLPFPDVDEDTTIESAVYNGFTNDVAQDLNAPRPIIAGGTSANNAVDAINNLGGEISKIQVTNYDSHAFTAGSFYSLAGATSAPVAGHAFAGFCYPLVIAGVATTDMFIEASDKDDVGQPGAKWIRQKKANVWSAWSKAAGTAAGLTPPTPAPDNTLWWDPTRGKLFIRYNDGDSAQWVEAVAVPDIDPNTFVEIAGDVMTGPLTLNANPANALHAAPKQYVDNSISTAVAGIDAKAVRYDTPQVLTSTQQAQARANVNITKKNYVINGGMQISQEWAGGAVSFLGANQYPTDMFNCTGSSTGGIAATGQQVASVTPGGAVHRLRITVTAANATVGSGDNVQIMHPIEGTRVVDLQSGTANAKTVTLRFGVKGPAGTYCVSILNAAANRFYIAEYVIAAGEANTDVVKTITLDLDKTGTWDYTSLRGLDIRWWLRGGSTFFGTANVWSATAAYVTSNQFNLFATNGNVWELFDVGLYESAVVPPFQMPDYPSELALCRRYYQKYLFSVSYVNEVAGARTFYTTIILPVSMRAAPTVLASNWTNGSSTTAGSIAPYSPDSVYASTTMTAGIVTAQASYNPSLSARL